MKTDSEAERFKETAKLFDYGYDNFAVKELFPAGYQLKDEKSVPVTKGKQKTVEVATKDAFEIPIKKSDEEKRSEEHTSELQSRGHLVCRLLLEKKKKRYARPRDDANTKGT